MNKTNWRYGNHHINILGISLIALGATLFVPNRVLAQWRVGASGGATFNHYSIDTQYQTDYRYFSVEGTPTSQYDLLVAKTTTSRKACGGTVPLSFIHACAAVWFNIGQSSTLNGKSITFTEIALTGIYNSGDYHFNTGTWTVLAGSASFSLEKASNIDIPVSSTSGEDARALRCGHLFMIPQTLGTGTKLVITYSGGTQTTAEIPLNGKT